MTEHRRPAVTCARDRVHEVAWPWAGMPEMCAGTSFLNSCLNTDTYVCRVLLYVPQSRNALLWCFCCPVLCSPNSEYYCNGSRESSSTASILAPELKGITGLIDS